MLKQALLIAMAISLVGSTVFSQDKINSKITSVPMYEGSKVPKAIKYYNEANLYGQTGDLKNAKKLYLKAIKADPEYVEAYDNLGLIYRKMGDYSKAIEYYKKSIKIYPEGHLAHQNLAVVYGLLDDYPSAIKEYEKLVKLSTEDPEGYFGLARSYLMVSKFDDALRNAEIALSLYKATSSHHLGDGYHIVGMAHYYKEDNVEARKYFKLAKGEGVKLLPQIEKEMFSGEPEPPKYKLDKAEDYAAYEAQVISDFKWLQDNPKGTDPAKRKEIGRFLIIWISGAPNVSVMISDKVVTFLDCADCLLMYMGGWTVYVLETKDEDQVAGAVAGVEAVIKFYQDNKDSLEANKDIEKYIELKEKGEMKAFIKKQM